MSDNTPITGELRELLADISWTEIIDHMQMNSGATLDGSWLDSWRAAADRACDAIDAIHANLERENESLRRELDRDGWVELPKDTDGEYIHIGDVMEWCNGSFTVHELKLTEDGWQTWDSEHGYTVHADECIRHHAPTVEDVLREFAYGLGVPVADSYVAATAAKLRLAGECERISEVDEITGDA